MKKLLHLWLKELTNRLKEQEIEFELTDAAKDKITEEGYDPEYGARRYAVLYKSKWKTAYQRNF